MGPIFLVLPSPIIAVASAQEIPERAGIQTHLSIDGRTGFLTDDPGLIGESGYAGRFDVSYTALDIPSVDQPLEDRLRTDVLAGYQWNFLRAGVDVPMYPSLSAISSAGTGLGAPAIDLRGTILDARNSVVGVAITARAWLGSTNDVPTERDDGGFAGAVVVGDRWADTSVALNLGWREVDFDPNMGDDLGDSFVARGAVRRGVSDAVAVFLDGDATLRYDREQLANDEGWVAGQAHLGANFAVGGGFGLEARAGTFIHQNRRDGDGPLDPAAGLALTWRGHGRYDRDADAVVAATDACADRTEDRDRYTHRDGCPDTRSRVTLTVLDPTGAPLDSYRMLVDGQAIDPSRAFVEPGHRVIEIDASKYKPVVVPLDVGPEPSQIIVQLAPAPSLGSQLVESLADALDPPRTERAIRFDERIHFAPSSTTFDRSSRRTLRFIADRIRAHPEIERVWVAGYSDRQERDDANPALSLARAKAVCTYLVSQGVRPGRLTPVGSRQHDPYLAGADDWNRRVEFRLTLKDDHAGVEPELNHGPAHDDAAASG